MSDYYRPTIPQRKKEEWQKFLENNPELPADNVRELIEFAVNQIIWEKNKGNMMSDKEIEAVREALNQD